MKSALQVVDGYISGAYEPDLPIIWRDWRLAPYDFSNPAWAFQLKVADVLAPTTVVLTKTTGFTGAAASATAPNLVISWTMAVGLTLNDSPVMDNHGIYLCVLKATSPGLKPRKLKFKLVIGSDL